MTREEKLQKAHRMFDNRNLLIELKWQREYFKSGYVNSQEELFNLWIFDECIKTLEQEPTTKNDLAVDCISRQAVIDMTGLSEWFDSSDSYNEFVIALSELPSVTPQEPILEKDGTLIVTTEHCEKVGRVLIQYGTNGTLFYQDQEPEIVPIAVVKFDENKLREIVQEKMDEIKKNLIEQYLEKITADIQRLRGCSCSCSDGIIDDIEDIIDKYRAESEK